jgi:ABC-type multidrug transport system ATPase subunit
LGGIELIRTEKLTKRYKDLTAVNELSIHVQPGEMYGFLGPNGAGKTTTIMMLLGLIRPTSGKVYLLGKEFNSDPLAIKKRVGVLSEFHYLYEDMTAKEYLRFFCDLYQVENADHRISEVLDKVDLLKWRDKLLYGFSKGMKQKLSIARTLLHDPDILILDEPVSSLDPHGIKEVRDILIAENEKGKTLFISSHILSEIERTCHRVGIIHKGQLMAEDTMPELKRRLTQELELIIEVEGPIPEIIQVLKNLPFVKSVEEHEGKLSVFTDTEQDHRSAISKAIASTGGVVLAFSKQEMTLEDAFMTITEKDIRLLAKEGSVA